MLILWRVCQLAFLVLYFIVGLDFARHSDLLPKWVKRYPRLFASAVAITVMSNILFPVLLAAFGHKLESPYAKEVTGPKLRGVSMLFLVVGIPIFFGAVYSQIKR